MMDREPTEEQKARAKLLENREWFDQNIHQIQKEYRGKVVAVYGNKVVAHGQSASEVKQEIRGKYPELETLIIMVPREEIFVVPYVEPGA